MQKQQTIFNRKKLVIAVGIAMLGGGLSGCNENDPISPDALGEWSILANGGTGGNVTGAGGEGGRISLNNMGGAGGAAILQRGKANTTFTTPSEVNPGAANLGDNPLNITADTTLDLNYVSQYEDGSGTLGTGQLYVGTDGVLRSSLAGGVADYAADTIADAGTYYVNSSDLFVSDGTAAADVAYTGLSVAGGATLTLANTNGNVSLTFPEDIDNSGTITRATTNPSSSIYLYARNYIASGNIANAGIDSADGDEHGGDVGIYTSNSIVNSGGINASGFNDPDSDDAGDGGEVTLDSGGYILNSGPVDVSGGDAPGAGGNGGEFAMFSAYSESTGDTIDASGGNNTSDSVLGSGGDGGEVGVGGYFIAINTSTVNANAGNGNNGGTGGDVFVSNEPGETAVGEVKNAGNININGGAGSDSSGGSAGMLYLSSFGGDALNSGDVSAVGGDTTGDASGAGYGGNVNIMASWGNGPSGEAHGDVEVSGDLNVSGGNAVAPEGTGFAGSAGSIRLDGAGYGGIVAIRGFGPSGDNDSRVALLGYTSIDANGGDGARGGSASTFIGNSLNVYTTAADSADPDSEDYEEGDTYGSIVNDVPVNARGGNSIAADTNMGSGGYGGRVSMSASTDGYFADPSDLDSDVTNKAAIDVSGGNAVTDLLNFYPAGPGGSVWLSAAANAGNSGDVTANGGAGGSDSYMGMGGYVTIQGLYGEAGNTAALTLNGGDGMQAGGNGGEVDITAGTDATNTGVIAANGGTGSYNGGYGGNADIGGGTSTNQADISVNGGNATVIDPDDTFTARGGNGGWIDIWGTSGLNAATNTGTLSYLFGTGEEDGEEGCATVGLVSEGNCNNN